MKEKPPATWKNPVNLLIVLVVAVLLLSVYTALSIGRLPQAGDAASPGENPEMITEDAAIKEFIDNYPDEGMYIIKGSAALMEFEKGNTVILDVRSENMRENGYIVDSIHIPFPQILSRISELPYGEIIAVYCEDNTRAAFATTVLRMYGYEAYVLEDGIDGWIAAGGDTTLVEQEPPPRSG